MEANQQNVYDQLFFLRIGAFVFSLTQFVVFRFSMCFTALRLPRLSMHGGLQLLLLLFSFLVCEWRDEDRFLSLFADHQTHRY